MRWQGGRVGDTASPCTSLCRLCVVGGAPFSLPPEGEPAPTSAPTAAATVATVPTSAPAAGMPASTASADPSPQDALRSAKGVAERDKEAAQRDLEAALHAKEAAERARDQAVEQATVRPLTTLPPRSPSSGLIALGARRIGRKAEIENEKEYATLCLARVTPPRTLTPGG